MPDKNYNLSFLNDYFDENIESISPILKMYLEETPKEISKIENALLTNDALTAKASTHKIKTNVAMLGIRDNSTFIEDMHQLLPADPLTPENIAQFQLLKEAVSSALQQIREDFFPQ